MDSSGAREVKVVLLGDVAVGKTSLTVRFVTDMMEPYSESTIGASFMSKTLVVGGAAYKYQIWDTAGQEKYHSLAPMYYRNAAAALLVYDITNSKTFATLKAWVRELRELGPEGLTIVLCGNKSDLEAKRQISASDAAAYAAEIDALFFETSAVTRANVNRAFEAIVEKLPPLPGGGGFEDVFFRGEGGGGGRGGGKKGTKNGAVNVNANTEKQGSGGGGGCC